MNKITKTNINTSSSSSSSSSSSAAEGGEGSFTSSSSAAEGGVEELANETSLTSIATQTSVVKIRRKAKKFSFVKLLYTSFVCS